MEDLCLPAALGDDHFGAEFVKLLPQILALERDLGIVDDAIVLGLESAKRSHCRMQLMGHGRCKDNVLGGGVGGAQRMMGVRMCWMWREAQTAGGAIQTGMMRSRRAAGQGG